ncbi:MAG TPA: hypothetical protein VNP95_13090, partial [Thermomicrobiales bacterium]|nr:hypothetical protein [Thermomicrobiales bacterium]
PTTESGALIEPAATQESPDAAPTIGPASETPGQDQSVPNDGTGGASTEIVPSGETATPEEQAPSRDPGRSLGAADGSARIEASGDSWAPLENATAPQTSASGITVTAGSQGELQACGSSGACQPIELDGDRGTGSGSPTPIGWIDDTLIVERQSGSEATYYALSVSSDGTPDSAVVLGSGAASSGPAYVFGDSLLIETASGWFRASATDGVDIVSEHRVLAGQALRFYPDLNVVGAIVDGNVIFQNAYNGTTDARIPANGIDFALSDDGTYVAVSTGSTIEIWMRYGDQVNTYTPPSGDRVGSVAWAGTDLMYVDTSTGEVRIISPSDFGPGST